MSDFKKSFPLQKRIEEARRIRLKYPDRVPIIAENSPTNSSIPNIDKSRFLVPADLTLSQFIFVIRKRILLQSDQALFLMINNKLMPGSNTIQEIYATEKDVDGFLYVTITGESVFG